MGKIIKDTIHAAGVDIGIYTQDFENEFISLTDIARYKSDDPTAVIQNWMRNRDVIEFLGLWERLHNPDFKPLEFEGFRKQAGANAFTMSPKKWIEATDAIGIVSKAGRYGGTYAHKVTLEATEKAEGVKTYTCTVCNATKAEAIAKLVPSGNDNPDKGNAKEDQVSAQTNATSPETGDRANMFAWVLMMIASAGAITVFYFRKRTAR